MTVLVIAANNLRRLIRQRASLFFVFVLPLMLILVLGVTVGGDEPRIGVHVEGEVSPQVEALIDALEQLDGVGVELFDEFGSATDELEREDITALVVVPVGYDDSVASGEATELEYRVIRPAAVSRCRPSCGRSSLIRTPRSERVAWSANRQASRSRRLLNGYPLSQKT